ncbi:MAG: polysaccharide deacetylase family protein [Paraglaciecola sp.]|uniref:polysaccharide deacetylase family protein n=1 Tax=Paraglaciecola sp. TaxID=1920173 RepID=UPI00273F0199|nr:polysaccharide deacetylase family protein [Paraglaciecola sp.]MDP5031415.1 polysaccharide deacetylase family protein [Paraglaciecola sp.]MDP5129239.1 polysaccharide deacetylase family protein [Paraglaciecola sp.]
MSNNRDNKKTVLFVLSVDTEEEWDWSGEFPQKNFSIDNVFRLSDFQHLCNDLGVKPTYFIDYAVAENDKAAAVFKQPEFKENCEIGAHLHPWCNPPYFGHVSDKESHVVNLPIEQVEQKLASLVKLLSSQFGEQPRSFRTGRWGIDAKVMRLLTKYNFTLDSSVYPFWQNEYFSCHGAPERPYWPNLNAPLQEDNQQKLIFELPVTAGFNHKNSSLCEKAYRMMEHPTLRWTRITGVAWRTKLLRKSYLSPELFDVPQLLDLSKSALANGTQVLHMFMHSSSLIDNNNSLVGNRDAYKYITEAIRSYISQLQQSVNLEFCTISEAGKRLSEEQTSNE